MITRVIAFLNLSPTQLRQKPNTCPMQILVLDSRPIQWFKSRLCSSMPKSLFERCTKSLPAQWQCNAHTINPLDNTNQRNSIYPALLKTPIFHSHTGHAFWKSWVVSRLFEARLKPKLCLKQSEIMFLNSFAASHDIWVPNKIRALSHTESFHQSVSSISKNSVDFVIFKICQFGGN